jgi:hypothetical protein
MSCSLNSRSYSTRVSLTVTGEGRRSIPTRRVRAGLNRIYFQYLKRKTRSLETGFLSYVLGGCGYFDLLLFL